jgi:hypothetical protein
MGHDHRLDADNLHPVGSVDQHDPDDNVSLDHNPDDDDHEAEEAQAAAPEEEAPETQAETEAVPAV